MQLIWKQWLNVFKSWPIDAVYFQLPFDARREIVRRALKYSRQNSGKKKKPESGRWEWSSNTGEMEFMSFFSFGFPLRIRHSGFSIHYSQTLNLPSLLPPAWPPSPCTIDSCDNRVLSVADRRLEGKKSLITGIVLRWNAYFGPDMCCCVKLHWLFCVNVLTRD